ncbi:hypothetical protein [Microbulbifer rhizosphaerae]|uniref:Carboxypeptidase regulatory-like domain-containing protein n=1 Tax=Microbulbifer rhizosphaerae TaxID=1562603 RepID=A0A7W4Z8F8_9GAMM|nr:hypothetical protein [Microbulbifer rhizosphaerae]MBB3060537.1 hypothetical protein [Microbulbifer rhizosphaerae]
MGQLLFAKPKTYLKTLSFALLTTTLFACGGNGGSSLPDSDNDVTDPPPASVDLSFVVQTHDGARLSGVSVTLDDSTIQSDETGWAHFNLPDQEFYVVRAEAEGFVSQAMKVNGENESVMPIRLTPVKQTLSLDDIESARTLSAADLGARITFPAGAFVTPDGEPATGSARVQITPWDITNGELNAMPGNGQAVDAAGAPTELISAGMLTLSVHNEAGDYLQLAPGTTAEIQMDLPQGSINNAALTVGSTVPMWHFDETQGIWVEDDSIIGTVVASATSPVGLAVHAEVSHFSTWNWDFKFENGGSINVECRLFDNSPVPCGISAEVTLDDGSVFTRNGQLPEGGSTIINMPTSATIDWHATSFGGFMGDLTSDMSADVVIALDAPTSENFVRCELPDGTGVNCSVTLTDGTHDLTQTVPAQGATIFTGWPALDEFTEFSWVAVTPNPVDFAGQQVLGEGSVNSGIAEDVLLTLTTTPVEAVDVQCLSSMGTTIPCVVELVASLPNGEQFTQPEVSITDSLSINVPSEATLIQWSATSNGAYSQNGQFVELSGTQETGLVSSVAIILDEESVQGPAAQSIQLYCSNSQDTAATTCDIEINREGNGAGYGPVDSFDDVPVGDAVTLEFPDGMAAQNDWVQVMATGDDGSVAYSFSAYGSLNDGESVELELQCSDANGGSACP